MADREALYGSLRAMMLECAPGMTVAKDVPGELILHAPWRNPAKPKDPVWFGMVKNGKAYVSVHLMPLYGNAALTDGVPESLRQRQQGKTCFNFKVDEPDLLAQLAALTRHCAEAFAEPV